MGSDSADTGQGSVNAGTPGVGCSPGAPPARQVSAYKQALSSPIGGRPVRWATLGFVGFGHPRDEVGVELLPVDSTAQPPTTDMRNEKRSPIPTRSRPYSRLHPRLCGESSSGFRGNHRRTSVSRRQCSITSACSRLSSSSLTREPSQTEVYRLIRPSPSSSRAVTPRLTAPDPRVHS